MKRNLAPYVFALLLAIDIATFGFAVAVKNKQDDTVTALKTGLIRNCERNANPLRIAVQNELRDQNKQSQNIKLYKQFFPTVSTARLHSLIEAQVAQRRMEIQKIAPVDCSALYR